MIEFNLGIYVEWTDRTWLELDIGTPSVGAENLHAPLIDRLCKSR